MSRPRIASLILAHQDAPQVARLCRALQGHTLFVHIDRKADFPLEQIAAMPGVVLHPRSVIHWADYSIVEATLSLMDAARHYGTFDRFVLLSGSCYPVKPLSKLEELFANDTNREWISLTPLSRQSDLYITIDRHWRMKPLPILDSLRRIRNKASSFIGRNLSGEIGMTPYLGSQFWALTEPCVAYILEFVREHPAYVRAYRSVYSSDEQFFHTIVANSRFAPLCVPVEDHGHMINHFAPLHQIAIGQERCFGNTESDFQLAASTDKFFIRKVSSACSQLLDRIDCELLAVKSVAR